MREYKLKMEENKHEKWEDINSFRLKVENDIEHMKSLGFLSKIDDLYEIRWNYPGSLQGHYVLTT